MIELPTVKVDLVSDVICPWCYIAKTRLERVEKELKDELILVKNVLPFLLYPNIPAGGIHKSAFAGKTRPGMGRSLRIEANKEGIEINYRLIENIPNSLEAHRLLWLAGKGGKQYTLARNLFRAYFEEGQNLEDPAVLLAEAGKSGVEEAVIRRFGQAEAGRIEVLAAIEEIRNERYITVVPTFILNDQHLITGIQSDEVLSKYLLRAAALGKKG